MRRLVYQVDCPGCGRRIRAPSEDVRRARVLRHVRNCAFLGQAGAPTVPLDAVQSGSNQGPIENLDAGVAK